MSFIHKKNANDAVRNSEFPFLQDGSIIFGEEVSQEKMQKGLQALCDAIIDTSQCDRCMSDESSGKGARLYLCLIVILENWNHIHKGNLIV